MSVEAITWHRLAVSVWRLEWPRSRWNGGVMLVISRQFLMMNFIWRLIFREISAKFDESRCGGAILRPQTTSG